MLSQVAGKDGGVSGKKEDYSSLDHPDIGESGAFDISKFPLLKEQLEKENHQDQSTENAL